MNRDILNITKKYTYKQLSEKEEKQLIIKAKVKKCIVLDELFYFRGMLQKHPKVFFSMVRKIRKFNEQLKKEKYVFTINLPAEYSPDHIFYLFNKTRYL